MHWLRRLLFPVAAIYGFVTALRNRLFDLGWLKSYPIPGRSICIGNLNVGGSGKSPLTRYLMAHLQQDFEVQVLLRGYGRKTRGHLRVADHHSAQEVGDEALQYYGDLQDGDEVHVCEKRKDAITTLARDASKVLLLDDAFQHRYVRAGLSLLVSEYEHPFFRDYLMPVGSLREARRGAKRADALIFTKCPDNLSEELKKPYVEIGQRYGVPVFFSSIRYLPLKKMTPIPVNPLNHVLLVTGIAHPEPLLHHLEASYTVTHLKYPDHFQFTLAHLRQIHQKFSTFDVEKTIIITTEKDFVRLSSMKDEISKAPWFVQPIGISFDREALFLTTINEYVRKN